MPWFTLGRLPKIKISFSSNGCNGGVKNSILSGLLKDGLDEKNDVDLNKILKAIEYFKDEDLKDAY